MINIPKFASIESFDPKELKALFEHISIDILKSNPTKIKKDVLGLKGTLEEINGYNPTIQSIVTLIALYDLKFEFSIKYIEEDEEDFSDAALVEAPKATGVKKVMEEQRKEIKPSVKAEVKREPLPPVVVGEPEKKEIKEADLPNFD